MDMFRSKRASAHQPLEGERPAKRISTPAGQRLSIVLENTHNRCFQPDPTSKPSKTSKINVTTTSTYCNDPTHQHIDPVLHVHQTPRKTRLASLFTAGRLAIPSRGSDDRSHNGSGSNLSVSVWSDKDTEKFGQVRDRKNGGARGGWGWKRIAIVAGVIVALIVGLAVGLTVGLKKKSSSSQPSSTLTSTSTPTSTSGDPQTASTTTGTNTAAPKSTSTLSPSVAPDNFPVGTYSLITFLDTVNKNCTSDPNTWTCTPITDYYSDPQKALAIMNWEITNSSGVYKITSRDSGEILSMTFQNEVLELLDAGKDTERYKFQMSRTKLVNVTGTLGEQNGDFECDYGTTTLQGHLYTKLARTYPADTIQVDDTGHPAWPYAARVEQVVGGGQNVPSCKTTSGTIVKNATEAQDAGSLCSCLYKNWTPALNS